MLGPCDEWRNLTLTDGSNPNFYDDLESFHPRLGNYDAFVTAAGFDADTPDCMLGLAKRREPHGRWDHYQLGGTRHGLQ